MSRQSFVIELKAVYKTGVETLGCMCGDLGLRDAR